MPPHLLQSVTNIPILLEAVAKALKMMKEAEVNSKVYVEYLINKLNKVIQPKPTLIYIIKKKHVFLSVRPSTFFISLISRKVLPLRKKIIVEIGFKNCKELNYKKIFEKQ